MVISLQYSIHASRRTVLGILARTVNLCSDNRERVSREVRLPTALGGNRPDLAVPKRGKMGGIAPFSGKNCTVGRLVASPRASQQHDGGGVVEIGALDHAGEHPPSQPETAVVDAPADALLQVRCPPSHS